MNFWMGFMSIEHGPKSWLCNWNLWEFEKKCVEHGSCDCRWKTRMMGTTIKNIIDLHRFTLQSSLDSKNLISSVCGSSNSWVIFNAFFSEKSQKVSWGSCNFLVMFEELVLCSWCCDAATAGWWPTQTWQRCGGARAPRARGGLGAAGGCARPCGCTEIWAMLVLEGALWRISRRLSSNS